MFFVLFDLNSSPLFLFSCRCLGRKLHSRLGLFRQGCSWCGNPMVGYHLFLYDFVCSFPIVDAVSSQYANDTIKEVSHIVTFCMGCFRHF